ncbi:group ISAba11 transposase (plasmid) [Cyanobacterium sp. HL-69]|nr:group ISAba11 transposase [Cyanobacterium sp. HL-69]
MELYSDYLISSFNEVTATGLSSALKGNISHDKVTRFLSESDFDSKQLWQLVKPVIRREEEEDGVLIFDDTIEEKPHTKESELICWHHDHSKNRSVKGINILNCVYGTNQNTIPVAFEVIKKPIEFCEIKTKKKKRRGMITKNELLRKQLIICQKNELKYKYVLTDSWFAAKENMDFIRITLGKHFIMALKSNRTVAISEQKKKQGHFIRIDELEWSEKNLKLVWLKGVEFPILLHRQIFTNKDDSTGILYLACSNLDCNETEIETIYQKRWKVEVFHKTLKSNTGLANSPTKCVRTQCNHIFMSIYAAFQLECLKIKHKMNHFALRSRIYIKALQEAMNELQLLKVA